MCFMMSSKKIIILLAVLLVAAITLSGCTGNNVPTCNNNDFCDWFENEENCPNDCFEEPPIETPELWDIEFINAIVKQEESTNMTQPLSYKLEFYNSKTNIGTDLTGNPSQMPQESVEFIVKDEAGNITKNGQVDIVSIEAICNTIHSYIIMDKNGVREEYSVNDSITIDSRSANIDIIGYNLTHEEDFVRITFEDTTGIELIEGESVGEYTLEDIRYKEMDCYNERVLFTGNFPLDSYTSFILDTSENLYTASMMAHNQILVKVHDGIDLSYGSAQIADITVSGIHYSNKRVVIDYSSPEGEVYRSESLAQGEIIGEQWEIMDIFIGLDGIMGVIIRPSNITPMNN